MVGTVSVGLKSKCLPALTLGSSPEDAPLPCNGRVPTFQTLIHPRV